jgi:hypothetical protein
MTAKSSNGGTASQIKVVLRNPRRSQDVIDYTIEVNDTELAQDWLRELSVLLRGGYDLEKNFCFLGFPDTQRNLEYLCGELNRHIQRINRDLPGYHIDLEFTTHNVFAPDPTYEFNHLHPGPNHELFNDLHNHFEILQGTVGALSAWYLRAPVPVKYSIRQLNNICHEMESLILSLRRRATAPEWIRPSQITTWLNAPRSVLQPEHRQGFLDNGYDRRLGGVYMHWAQIGKTLFEVWRDESAPDLDHTTCEAITHLEYYSGEFDIEWGRDVLYGLQPWHTQEQDQFRQWLTRNGYDAQDPRLSLGYLPLGQVDLQASFGTTVPEQIWSVLSGHLDIWRIEMPGASAQYDHVWSQADHEQHQIEKLQAGYRHHGDSNGLDTKNMDEDTHGNPLSSQTA